MIIKPWRLYNCILILIGYFPPSFSFSSEPEIYPQIVEIEPGYFQFGDLVIDRKNREFVLPALCNQTYGLIEYALVHENGKVHESLFRTSVSPRLIHACLLLLKESPQTDFFKNLQANQPNFSTLRTIEVFADWENNGSTFSEDLSALQYSSLWRLGTPNASSKYHPW